MTETSHPRTAAHTDHHETATNTAVLDVVVAVGTDVHPFDRLMIWLQEWHSARPDHPRMLIQHGRSSAPAIPGAVAFLDHHELVEAMGHAQVVVTHGGPASIAEAWRHGHRPIVVARDPAYGEHVDNHQMLFTTRMAANGLIRLCASGDQLGAALDAALAEPPARLDGPDPATARATAVATVGRIIDRLITEGRPR